jgi:Skp family chaperone for outer membrane proteins
MKTKLMILGLFLLVSVGASAAELNEVNPNTRAIELLDRVQQIRTMELKELSPEEKSELRSEVKEIRSELKELKSTKGLDDKVQISVGLIIIILLLIILL